MIITQWLLLLAVVSFPAVFAYTNYHYYRQLDKRYLKMTEMIFWDTETKLRHINKYNSMHAKLITYEIGLIIGAILTKFRSMLKLYRRMSQNNRIRWSDGYYWAWLGTFHANLWWLSGNEWHEELLSCSSRFLEILTYRLEFTKVVEAYMKKNMATAAKMKRCKVYGQTNCHTDGRRNLKTNTGKPKSADDFEVDYFGHLFPKTTSNKTTPDRVAQLFKLEELKSTPFEELPEVKLSPDTPQDFTKINDWLEYLAHGGIEKNKKLALEEREADFAEDIAAAKAITKDLNKFKTSTLADLVDFTLNSFTEHPMPLKSSKRPRVYWGQRGSDYEYKKKIREQHYAKIRGNFDPKREGIEIDLEDMF